MNQLRTLSFASLAGRWNAYFAARHFTAGVLIGAAVLAAVFVLA